MPLIPPANLTSIRYLRQSVNAGNGSRQAYRVMVESIQSGDLGGARQAYQRLTGTLPRSAASPYAANTNAAGVKDVLSGIGIMLAHGDLAAAQRAVTGLEAQALQVLRAAANNRSAPAPSANDQPGYNQGTFRITI